MISNIVASRSFRYICNHFSEDPDARDINSLPKTFPQKYGETVYMHPEMLLLFIEDYLPKITIPFVLVTGDADTTIPNDIDFVTSQILKHPMLLCWFAQNCIEPSEKFKQIPIGLDFHTLTSSIKPSWDLNINNVRPSIEELRTISQQEEDIKNILNENIINREIKCYANFHFNMTTRYMLDRKDALESIPSELVYYENTPLKRVECWKNMAKYKFVISPHGNGLDCHRTWEALALGCFPIIKSSELDDMFQGLPVIIVSSWNEITQDFLDKYKNLPTFIPYQDKMYMNYWINYIKSFQK